MATVTAVVKNFNSGALVDTATVTMAATAGLTALPYFPKVATLQDDFTTLDTTTKWSSSGSYVSVVSGQLNLASPVGSQNPAYISSGPNFAFAPYDLTESAAVIQVVNAGNQSLASLVVQPILLTDHYYGYSDSVYWQIAGNQITAFRENGGTTTQLATAAYSSTTHQWLRIREHAGTIYFDYSANGNIWTNFASGPDISHVTNLNIQIQGGTTQAEVTATTVILDNFNLIPAPAVGLSGTSVLRVTPIGPKYATLFDDFSSGSFNRTKWTYYGTMPVVQSAQLVLNLPSAAGSTSGFGSYNPTYWDLTESYVLAQMIPPSTIPNTLQATLRLQDPTGGSLTQITWQVVGGASGAIIRAYLQGVGYLGPNGFSGVPYTSAFQWVRIREHAGTVYLDYSADGNIWTNFGSGPDPISVTYLGASIIAYDNNEAVTAVAVDNFNVLPPAQAALSGSTSLLASPQVFGNTVLTGTSGMTLAASVQQYAGITLQGNCSMTAAGMVLEAASAPLTATAGMSVSSQAQQFAAVNESATASMTVAASASSTSPIVLSQTAALTVAASVKQNAVTPMSGSAALVVAGSRGTSGTLTQTGVAAMVVAASVQQAAAYSAVVNGKLTVAAVVYGQTSPVLNVNAVLTVAATVKEISTIALTGNVSLTILAIKTSNAAVTMTGVASQVTAGARVVVGGVSMVAVTNQVTGGLTVEQGGMVMAATTTLTGSGSQSIISTVAFNGQASMQASTAPLWMGTMLMSATAGMTAGGYALTGSTFSGAANTTLSTTLVLENLGSVAMAALARLVPVGLTSPVGAVAMAASTSLNIRVFLALSSSVHMSATTSVMVTGTSVVERASIFLRSTPVLTVTGTRVRVSVVPLTGAVRLTVAGHVRQHASVSLAASSTLVPVFSVIDWGSIVMPVKATLVATATDKIFTGFTLRATAKLTVSGVPVRLDAAHLVGATGMQVSALVTQVTVVSLSSSTDMQVTGRTAIIGSVVLAGQSSLTIQRALVDMLAVSELMVSATQTISPSVDLLGQSALEMTTEVEQVAAVIMAVATALIVYGRSHGSTPFDWPSLADQLEGLTGMDPSMVHLARNVDDVFPQRLYGPTQ